MPNCGPCSSADHVSPASVQCRKSPPLRIRSGGLFLHCTDAGETWSALEHGPQFGMLLRRGHGEHFNAAVPQISHEATHLQLFRGVLREVAEAHTLDHSRDEVTPGLFGFAHESPEL